MYSSFIVFNAVYFIEIGEDEVHVKILELW